MFAQPQAHDPQATVIVRRARWKLWLVLVFATSASVLIIARIKGILPGDPIDNLPQAWFIWFIFSFAAAVLALQLIYWRQAVLILSPDGIIDRRNGSEARIAWKDVTEVRLKHYRFVSFVLLYLTPAAQERLFTSPLARMLNRLDNLLFRKSGIAVSAGDNQISPQRLAALCAAFLEARKSS